MNFFGHAWVAGWFSESEPFLLGSMLPDLASALRAGVPGSSHPGVVAGVRVHHETDRVFHQSGAFQSLEQHARSALAGAGLSKGPRRALAHIGVEFLIDDELGARGPSGERQAAVSRYVAALDFGGSSACASVLHWGDAGDAARFAALCRRIARASAPAPAPSSPARPSTSPLGPERPSRVHPRPDADLQIAARLVACLAGRPRLELRPGEAAALEP